MESRTTINIALKSYLLIFDVPLSNPVDVDDAEIEQLIEKTIERNISNRNFGRYSKTESIAKSFRCVIASDIWRAVFDDESG